MSSGSKTVDEKVVEMRFDNAQFEKNVQGTMNSIEKLKQKLKFKGAGEGIEKINDSVKHVNMSGLKSGIETVKLKFSSLEVIAVTALANITNSAVNAGKRMVSALTLDPVRDGFTEYETQMDSVQTILANTQKEGTNVKTVNKYLDELNTYADKTIYNFTEMTRNIGTFTAAGVKLDASVSAIKGIANLAAVSGSNSQQASTAMYQLSQALAAGKVQLMDWNSVVNAGMGGQVFQDALIRTSEHLQTGAKAAIEARGSFRESLQDEWLTTEVLTETLDQFATAADTQEEYAAAVKKFVDQGYSQEEAKEMADMAKTANDAATKVKTFTQLIDTLKEALGSGWTKTWQLVIGDFEDAKELWTGVSDTIGGFINDFSDARNLLLEKALSNPFKSISDKLDDLKGSEESVTDATTDLGDTVNKVLSGDFGDGEDRMKNLTDAGFDWASVQNLVNEQLGDATRYNSDYAESQSDVVDSQAKTIESLANMSDEELRNLNLTDAEISSLHDLKDQSDKTGKSISELFKENAERKSGRELLIDGFKNIGESIVNTFSAIGKAWHETFTPTSSDDLYSAIKRFDDLTKQFKVTDEDADKLRRTFKGLFTILDLITTITGGGIKLAFKALTYVLGLFDMDVLDLTANLGDLIVKIHDLITKNALAATGMSKLGDGIKFVVSHMKKFYEYFVSIPQVQSALEKIKDIDWEKIEISAIEKLGKAINAISNGARTGWGWLKKLFSILRNAPALKPFFDKLENIDLRKIGEYVIEGFQNGIVDKAKGIPKVLIQIGKDVLNAIKGVLGIHSPSKEMYSIGSFTIEGFVNGIKDGAGAAIDAVSDVAGMLLDKVRNLPWGKAMLFGTTAGLTYAVKKTLDIMENFSEPFAGIGEILESANEIVEQSGKNIQRILKNTSKAIKSFSKVLKAEAFKKQTEGIKDLAISVGILAASIYVLSNIDVESLKRATISISVMVLVMAVLAAVVSKLSQSSTSISKDGIDIKGMRNCLMQIGLATLLIAESAKILGKLDADQFKQGMIGLAACVGSIVGVAVVFGILEKLVGTKEIDNFGKMMLKMAAAMAIMSVTVKIAGTFDDQDASNGVKFAVAFLVFLYALTKINGLCKNGNIEQLGNSLIKISIAMGILVLVTKMISKMEWPEIRKGIAFALGFSAFLFILAIVGNINKGSLKGLSSVLLSVSISMMLMVGVMKLVGMLSLTDAIFGGIFAVAFILFIKYLVKVTTIGRRQKLGQVAGTILAASVAIALMAGVCALLGTLNLWQLAKGILVVGVFGIIIREMVKATRGAKDCRGSILAMAAAIAVIAVAVAALSFIPLDRLAITSACLAGLMFMFAVIEKAGSNIQSSVATVAVMAGVIAVLSVCIYALAQLPIENTLASSVALSVLLLAMAGAMAIISGVSSVAPTALIGVGLMTAVIAVLSICLYALSSLPTGSAMQSAEALSLLILSITAAMVVTSLVPAPAAISGATGLAAFIGIMAGVLTALGALTQIPGVSELMKSGGAVLAQIGYAIGDFVGSIIGGAAAGISSGLPEVATNLSLFIENLEPFLDGIKSIDALDLISSVGSLTGAILLLTAANFVSGIANILSIGSSLPDLGTQLSQFMTNLLPFIAGAATIMPGSMDGVNALAKTVLIITAADLLDGITSFITGGSSIDEFGEKLIPFGNAMVEFSDIVSGNIDNEAVTAAANAGKVMAEMAKVIPNSGGVAGFFAGENDIDDFGRKLQVFGNCIMQFSKTVSTNTINEEAVTAAANAGKIMAEMAKVVPNSGGAAGFFAGENDIDDFGEKLKTYGECIMAFAKEVSSSTINESAITAAANAGKIMATVADTIPNSGGVAGFFAGDNDIDTFGEKLSAFGSSMVDFSDVVSGNLNKEDIDAAIDVIKKVTNFATSIKDDEFGGLTILNDVFSCDLVDIGSALGNFSTAIEEGISAKDIQETMDACTSIIDMAKDVGNTDFSVLSNMAETLNSVADELASVDTSGMATFAEKLKDIGKSGASNLINSFKDSKSDANAAGKTLLQYIVDGISNNKSLASNGIKKLINETVKVTSAEKTKAITYGTTIVSGIASGISNGMKYVTTTMSTLMVAAVNVINGNYFSFYNSGKYIARGLAEGINDNSFRVKAAATVAAEVAMNAARATLAIHSPSRKFRQIGRYIPAGMALGIKDWTKKVSNSSIDMAKTAINNSKNALAVIASIVDGDIDVSPVIKPVVDLSDINSKSSAINGIFGTDPLVALRAEAGVINVAMNRKHQNGGNEEVVTAIDKLRKDIGNINNNSYTINGITYDNGSEVSDAIETLVRAIRIGKRS